MIIFGAGASHGSQPFRYEEDERLLAARDNLPWFPRPPVTRGLFAERFGAYASKYPSCRPAIARLRQALFDRPESNIEQEIGALYQAAPTNPERARHLLALRYYLADVIENETTRWWSLFHGFTYYTDLLERLGTWRSGSGEDIVLVSFNYDRLLERSLEAQVGNWALTTFDSYVDRDDWRLYKLHGSTAWHRIVPSDIPRADPRTVIAHAAEIDVTRGELCVDSHGPTETTGEPTIALPGIAVPTDLKQTFECPANHLARFVAEIGKVDRLLTIGWRGAEPHAVELLAEHIRPGYELAICDIGEDDITAIHANLRLAGRRGRGPHHFVDGFAGLLRSDDLERWLDLPIL